MEFSWHWSQLHGTSENTIWTKPFFQVNGSQVGTSGAGGRPEVGPHQPRLGLDRIGLDPDAVLVARLRVRDLLERLRQALARLDPYSQP